MISRITIGTISEELVVELSVVKNYNALLEIIIVIL